MAYLILIISFCSILVNAQIGIGVENNSNGRILDFDDGCDDQGQNCTNKNGIILPIVSNLPIKNLVNGTMLLDGNDKALKVYENNTWKRLSFMPGNLSSIIKVIDAQEIGNGVILGSTSAEVNGALVLEVVDKALVLPKINKPYETVPNPYPGMVCYDTDSKSLMLFDGTYWNIWKEKKQ